MHSLSERWVWQAWRFLFKFHNTQAQRSSSEFCSWLRPCPVTTPYCLHKISTVATYPPLKTPIWFETRSPSFKSHPTLAARLFPRALRAFTHLAYCISYLIYILHSINAINTTLLEYTKTGPFRVRGKIEDEFTSKEWSWLNPVQYLLNKSSNL